MLKILLRVISANAVMGVTQKLPVALLVCSMNVVFAQNSPPTYSKVGRVEIAAAFELVLDCDACLAREVRKDDMVVGALLKGVHPDEGTDHKDEESVEDEDPVEEHKTAKNMGWLNNGSNGNYPSNEQRNGEDKTR